MIRKPFPDPEVQPTDSPIHESRGTGGPDTNLRRTPDSPTAQILLNVDPAARTVNAGPNGGSVRVVVAEPSVSRS
jgi:hypothetical protein